ncbi:MAG: lipoate-protein ligase A [Candidatus Phytoplasma cynodontis]|uniref:lipoate--protein ligase n=1 Tax='Cynodon dactylon' phytoplasma TaxID=295320 RepID=UPI001265D41D|nr:lipoate--protein ligase ['Cynodon dactylon' phytoplasma]KAB8121812.1 lipoate--protein ligase ['Cynodon dactylon' phytoplasma]WIA07721.1 MAG: lipoate-protein ligase A [Candidatus Phytoplasma cynodontis]
MILVKYLRKEDLKPFFYFALEEYILNNLLKKHESFFFLWKIKGIVIGKNQIIENEVNLDFVKKNKIDIFRRPTGGGCVYNDPKTPLFSIITKKEKDFSFKKYLCKIIDVFKKIGVNLDFNGRNDIVLGDKKVSGSSFIQNENGIIIHGTLLYDCDIDTMIRCITVDDEKLISKGIKSISSRVTNLKDHLKDNINQDQLMSFLENNLTNKVYILSTEEIKKVEKMSEKFSSPKWIYHEYPSYSKVLKKRFEWGSLNVLLSLKKGKIEKMSLTGDFFNKHENLSFFLEKFENIIYNRENIKKISENIDISEYILNASNKDFFDLLEENAFY